LFSCLFACSPSKTTHNQKLDPYFGASRCVEIDSTLTHLGFCRSHEFCSAEGECAEITTHASFGEACAFSSDCPSEFECFQRRCVQCYEGFFLCFFLSFVSSVFPESAQKKSSFRACFFLVFLFFFAGREFAEHWLVCVGGVLRATDSWQAIAREPILQCVVALVGIIAVRASFKFAGPLKQLVLAIWRRSRETKAKKKPRRPDTQAHAPLSTRSEG
jgi:hypothetical protein